MELLVLKTKMEYIATSSKDSKNYLYGTHKKGWQTKCVISRGVVSAIKHKTKTIYIIRNKLY